MNTETNNLTESFAEFALDGYSLPEWDELPDIDLYMDQVITLLSKYLDIFHKVSNAEKSVTPAMINNYVKLGTIPPPVKKRYSKIHLAYLIIVCTLKQTLDMSTIQKIVPVGLEECEVKELYTSFVKNQEKAFAYVLDSTQDLLNRLVANGNANGSLIDLIMQVSASANFYKIMTAKITDIQSKIDSK